MSKIDVERLAQAMSWVHGGGADPLLYRRDAERLANWYDRLGEPEPEPEPTTHLLRIMAGASTVRIRGITITGEPPTSWTKA